LISRGDFKRKEMRMMGLVWGSGMDVFLKIQNEWKQMALIGYK
jgi:hypothetical protein